MNYKLLKYLRSHFSIYMHIYVHHIRDNKCRFVKIIKNYYLINDFKRYILLKYVLRYLHVLLIFHSDTPYLLVNQ